MRKFGRKARGANKGKDEVIIKVTGTIGGHIPEYVKKALIGMELPAVADVGDGGQPVYQVNAEVFRRELQRRDPALHAAMLKSDPRLANIETLNLRPMWVNVKSAQ